MWDESVDGLLKENPHLSSLTSRCNQHHFEADEWPFEQPARVSAYIAEVPA
jgi:hypothetical protein